MSDYQSVRVDAYRNLRSDAISLQHESNVVEVTPAVLIADPSFVTVDDAQEVPTERRRSVKAYVRGEVVDTGVDAAFSHDLYADTFEVDEASVRYDPDDTDHFEIARVLSESPRISMDRGDTVGATENCELSQKAVYAYVTTSGVSVLFDPFTEFETAVSAGEVVHGD